MEVGVPQIGVFFLPLRGRVEIQGMTMPMLMICWDAARNEQGTHKGRVLGLGHQVGHQVGLNDMGGAARVGDLSSEH